MCSSDLLLSKRILVAALIVFTATAWYEYTKYIDLKIAWGGFSPIAWLYQRVLPSNFLNDFPSGIENFGNSALAHAYTLAYMLGVTPESFLPFVM